MPAPIVIDADLVAKVNTITSQMAAATAAGKEMNLTQEQQLVLQKHQLLVQQQAAQQQQLQNNPVMAKKFPNYRLLGRNIFEPNKNQPFMKKRVKVNTYYSRFIKQHPTNNLPLAFQKTIGVNEDKPTMPAEKTKKTKKIKKKKKKGKKDGSGADSALSRSSSESNSASGSSGDSSSSSSGSSSDNESNSDSTDGEIKKSKKKIKKEKKLKTAKAANVVGETGGIDLDRAKVFLFVWINIMNLTSYSRNIKYKVLNMFFEIRVSCDDL